MTGCAINDLDLESAEQGVAVTWTNAIGVSVNGNSLTKTAPAAWGNAGASSTLSVSGDAFVEFGTAETNRGKSVGLSVGDSNQNYTDIEYSIHLSGNGTFYVIENGVQVAQFGAYTTSDVFRVESVERAVNYLRNGSVFYTSTHAPQYPLLVDTALFHTGSTISNAIAGDYRFTNITGLAATGTTLVKTAADGWGNAGAIGVRPIREGDGFVQFSTAETTRAKIAGLSTSDPNASNTSIGWGIELGANARIRVIELGVVRGSFGAYAANDTFRVAVVGNQVRYSRNGAVFYTSTVAPTYPLVFDSALFTIKASLTNVAVDDQFWTTVTGADPIGGTLVDTAATGWGNSGAVSLGAIAAGAGYVEFGSREIDRGKALGLSHTSESNSYTDIDYAIALGSGGTVVVYENGAARGTFGRYTPADRFRVEVNAAGVVEYKKNGAVFFTSAAAPVYPLSADAALFSAGATLDRVSLVDLP